MSANRYDIEVLKQIPILQVAEKLGIVVRRNNTALCFGGHDTDPSLNFTPQKNLWHCFGCGKGGSTIELVKHALEVDFLQAAQWLTTHFGSSRFTNFPFKKPDSTRQLPSRTLSDQDPQYAPDPEVYGWFMQQCSIDQASLDYLIKVRGFRRDTIEKFGINSIAEPLRKINNCIDKWGIARLLRCGLITPPKQPSPTIPYRFPWWDQTILFPFFENGQIIYIQGRRLGPGAKYLNLVNVSPVMFNLKALEGLPDNSDVYICEGIPDTLAAYEYGLTAIGIPGAHSFRPEWAKRFLKFKISILPDNDPAGNDMVKDIKAAFRDHGKIVEVIQIPKGKDLCAFLKPKSPRNS